MRNRVVYWVVSGVFALGTTASIALYFTKAPSAVSEFHALGYPGYFIDLLGTAKILGLLAVFVPRVPRTLREWAYAGFTIDAASAVWSGIATGSRADVWIPPLAFVGLIVAGYLLRRRAYPDDLLASQPFEARRVHA